MCFPSFLSDLVPLGCAGLSKAVQVLMVLGIPRDPSGQKFPSFVFRSFFFFLSFFLFLQARQGRGRARQASKASKRFFEKVRELRFTSFSLGSKHFVLHLVPAVEARKGASKQASKQASKTRQDKTRQDRTQDTGHKTQDTRG